ncbi:MAG: hypothetical protein Q9168_000014 [Polycauliona sp. 1 TL-2023]
MSHLKDSWDGVAGVSPDKEERKILYATLDSFRLAHFNITHRRRQNFYALPSAESQLLSAPPFNFLSTLERVDDAIDANADIAAEILKIGLGSFGLQDGPGLDPVHWHGKAKTSDLDKARSTIRQFYRDWSSEGASERRASYGPVLRDIDATFANVSDKRGIRVLVPGAGLGRLVLELCKQGYDVEGNEVSYHQLIASNWILNHCDEADQYTLFPFASDFSNVISRADQLKMVQIPDVHAASALLDSHAPSQRSVVGRMSMTAADFTELYNDAKNKAAFEAVATVFFLDTAQNVIRYIQTVHHCLKPGGIWTNNGPLLWHWNSEKEQPAKNGHNEQLADHMSRGSIELTVEEVLEIIGSMGFEIDDRGIRNEESASGYVQNPNSLLQNSYRATLVLPAFTGENRRMGCLHSFRHFWSGRRHISRQQQDCGPTTVDTFSRSSSSYKKPRIVMKEFDSGEDDVAATATELRRSSQQYIVRDVDCSLSPVVVELQDLIENDALIHRLFTDMFLEVPRHSFFDRDPSGRPQIRDYKTLLQHLNDIISRAPEFNTTIMMGFPINAVLAFPMATRSGIAAFLDEKVNAQIRKILQTWAIFLGSPSSRYVLDAGPERGGWLGATALALMPNFSADYVCNPAEPHYGFQSWDDFFTRRLRNGARPVDSPKDSSVIANPCESSPYRLAFRVPAQAQFWMKEQSYSLLDMLADDALSPRFYGGTVYQAYLGCTNYHRWHSPVSGTIRKAYGKPGAYYAQAPRVGFDPSTPNSSQAYLTQVATRAMIFIDADDAKIGLMCFMPVGITECSSCEVGVSEGQRVEKGDEIGMFHYGGSTSESPLPQAPVLIQPLLPSLPPQPPPHPSASVTDEVVLMNSRFKQFGASFGSKRNPNRNRDNNTTTTSNPSNGSSLTLAPPSTTNGLLPTPSNHTSSTTSLPMNPPPNNGLGRPPSYTYNPNAPRTMSPMPPQQQQMAHHPPPIHTGAYPQGHPALNGAQQQPPGYGGGGGGAGGGYPQPNGMHGAGAPQPTLGQYPTRGPPVEVEGAGRSKAQLIVGIDFVSHRFPPSGKKHPQLTTGQGTTFSGVAFAFATNTEAKEDIITEWPGAGNQTKQKIPTVLYYDQYQKVVGWGPDIADALAPTGYPKPGVQKVEWFKLQLMLSGNTYIDPINLPPLPPGKSEIDVAADYLFKLRQAMRNQLQKTLGEVFNREERNIRYFLTVPAIWNDAGKAATRAAAIQAGFLRDENDNRLTLITEPEAAAMFCSKTGLLNLKIRDAVLIVDCGGGTVDLIAYEVEEETPFTVAECTAGSGDSCGSTALNRNFSNILRAKIRKMKLPDGSKTAGKVYAKCIMDFENRIKADFRNNGQKWAVDVGIEAEFPEAGIEEGYMTFTNEEILQCFEPVVNRILELVRNQIIAIQAQNRLLQNVLVVGGFGASEYLFQQIRLHVPPQFQSKVVRPMDSVAAIVKGAVTAGITERVITSRVARRHYLMATLQPFREGHHPEQYRVPSLDGKDRCKYTRQIFVQKGQRVKIGEPVKVSFFRQVAPGATLMYEDILYACDEDVCPEYTKDPRIKEVVTLTSDLSRKNLEKDFERMDTPQGTFYRVYFDILLALDGSEFNAELVCQGEHWRPDRSDNATRGKQNVWEPWLDAICRGLVDFPLHTTLSIKMRIRKFPSISCPVTIQLLLLLPTLTYGFDCSHIRADKQSFDISDLGNPISVMKSENHSPSPTMTNTTFTIDICKPLKKAKGIPKEEDCPNGTRICAIKRLINTFENSTSFEDAIPIAGQYTLHGGTELDPDITRLKTSSTASDREKEGFRLAVQGPKYPETNGLKQKAVIEFLCADKATEKKEEIKKRQGVVAGRDDEEEDHSATGEVADDGHGGTLKYLDYSTVGESQVLSLEWRTKYACEDAGKNGSDDKNSSGHWGVFTWFIIIIFLGTAAYLIFGSWLNYNRYSARGWDLVPHSETIRDIPYIFKDWMRRVVSTLQGGGSRGGYSAV